ncbi:MAG: hypothetical protein ACE5H7_16575 [Acidiferrobacterales bacterium]
MPLIIDKFSKLHRTVSHTKESDLQACVTVVASQMFGATTVYVDGKKRLGGDDVVTIPSGYVIDLTEPQTPRLFVVKVAIAQYAPFFQLGVDLFKFVAAFDEHHSAICDYLRSQISQDTEGLARLQAACQTSAYNAVNEYLDQAVRGRFRGLVVIDEAREELQRMLGKINADFSVLELKTYEAEDGSRLYQIDTLYGEPATAALMPSAAPAPPAGQMEAGGVDTLIVPTREESFKRLFLREDQWPGVSIAPAMKEKIRYVAAYQPAPVNAVTHFAEVREIVPCQRPGQYVIVFKGPAQEIRPIPLKQSHRTPLRPVYARKDVLMRADTLEAVFPEQ